MGEGLSRGPPPADSGCEHRPAERRTRIQGADISPAPPAWSAASWAPSTTSRGLQHALISFLFWRPGAWQEPHWAGVQELAGLGPPEAPGEKPFLTSSGSWWPRASAVASPHAPLPTSPPASSSSPGPSPSASLLRKDTFAARQGPLPTPGSSVSPTCEVPSVTSGSAHGFQESGRGHLRGHPPAPRRQSKRTNNAGIQQGRSPAERHRSQLPRAVNVLCDGR